LVLIVFNVKILLKEIVVYISQDESTMTLA
jgi:hypothetical protein